MARWYILACRAVGTVYADCQDAAVAVGRLLYGENVTWARRPFTRATMWEVGIEAPVDTLDAPDRVMAEAKLRYRAGWPDDVRSVRVQSVASYQVERGEARRPFPNQDATDGTADSA